MRTLLVVLMFLGIGGSSLEAEVNIKQLWEQARTPKKKPIKSLWKSKKSQSTVVKIHDSQSTLNKTSREKIQTNQRLERIAKAIRKAEQDTITINKVLDRLEEEQKKTENKYREAKKQIDQFGGKITKLDTKIKGWHEAFIRVLVDQFSLIAAKKALGRPTVHGIVQAEVYKAYTIKNSHELQTLKHEIDGSKKVKARLLQDKKRIEKSINSIMAKRKLYRKKKAQKKRLLTTLSRKEEEYRARLKEIMQRQDSLRQTLAQLNILHKKEIAEAQRAEQARREELRRKTAELKRMRQAQAAQAKRDKAEGRAVSYAPARIEAPGTATGTVKKYGSSYQAGNVQAYRGRRTISPLAHARVVKRFGSYIDPIYKIRIFNDNVVLKSSKTGAKVRNVLNGKVVYVGQNSMLGKVVIIEHGNKLHTIYAALDRFSPVLHNGSRVKKGTIIGRVKRKLIFQATQNSKYINPLSLIRL